MGGPLGDLEDPRGLYDRNAVDLRENEHRTPRERKILERTHDKRAIGLAEQLRIGERAWIAQLLRHDLSGWTELAPIVRCDAEREAEQPGSHRPGALVLR